MRTINKFILGLCCLLSLTFAACEAKDSSSTPSPYPVYDSGAWADPLFDPEIYWIDNNRVIFKGVKDNNKRNISIGPFNLSVWEIGKGVKPYTEYYQSVTVCVRDGMIHRTQKDASGTVQRFYGKFGEEKPFEFPKTKGAFFDEMNCHPNENPEILTKRAAGRAIRPLLDRHGYLDIGPNMGPESRENNPITLYRPDGTSVKLASRRFELVYLIGYFPFKGAYLFQGALEKGRTSDVASYWPSGTQQIFTWLYPEGHIEPMILSPESWPDKRVPNFGFIGALMPVKYGFVLPHGKAKGPKDAGNAGPHLLRNSKLIKLLSGYYKSPAVSPDGCKVAFVYFPYSDATITADPAPIRLKAVDLCQKNEEKAHGQ